MKQEIQVLYQSAENGKAWEVTTLLSSPKWDTKRVGSPESLKFSALPSEVEWKEGGVVCLKINGEGIFYGYIFRIAKDEEGKVDLTAYSQLRYLKNKDTYVFSGQRADEITRQIAEDFKLKLGELANTGYAIPSMCEDNASLLDIISKALDYTMVNTGKMFYLWDEYGKLRLSSVEESKLDLVVGENSLATGYKYESEIDSATANKIKLVRENKDTGRREVYVVQDSETMTRWGTLQHFEKLDEKLNPAQIAQRGDNLLELKNRPKRSFSLEALGDVSVRAGCALFVQIPPLAINHFCVVEEASHDFAKGTMGLKVRVV